MERGEHPFHRAAPTGKRIAVVGAGPAGLACAHRLALHGHDVTIFDAREKPGGLNEYGIAAYKAPNEFAQREVDFILAIGGIIIENGKALGRDFSIADLKGEYDAVFLRIGLAGGGETVPLPADMVFKAIGQTFVPAPLDGAAAAIKLESGRIAVDAERRTSMPGVWAGGDCVAGGEDLTVAAAQDGKLAAESIHR